jgi:hypothetical protein
MHACIHIYIYMHAYIYIIYIFNIMHTHTHTHTHDIHLGGGFTPTAGASVALLKAMGARSARALQVGLIHL